MNFVLLAIFCQFLDRLQQGFRLLVPPSASVGHLQVGVALPHLLDQLIYIQSDGNPIKVQALQGIVWAALHSIQQSKDPRWLYGVLANLKRKYIYNRLDIQWNLSIVVTVIGSHLFTTAPGPSYTNSVLCDLYRPPLGHKNQYSASSMLTIIDRFHCIKLS